jgi:uncharacterized phage protein (predicted DNA packaging)
MIVSVDELKTHLRIQHSEEDSLLESLIAQAQAVAENICREAFENDAPEPVRLAVILMASYFYENRDVSDKTGYSTMYTAFRALISPYEVPETMF